MTKTIVQLIPHSYQTNHYALFAVLNVSYDTTLIKACDLETHTIVQLPMYHFTQVQLTADQQREIVRFIANAKITRQQMIDTDTPLYAIEEVMSDQYRTLRKQIGIPQPGEVQEGVPPLPLVVNWQEWMADMLRDEDGLLPLLAHDKKMMDLRASADWHKIEGEIAKRSGINITYHRGGFSQFFPCPNRQHHNDTSAPGFRLNAIHHVGHCGKCNRAFTEDELMTMLQIGTTPAEPEPPSLIQRIVEGYFAEEMASIQKWDTARKNAQEEMLKLPKGDPLRDVYYGAIQNWTAAIDAMKHQIGVALANLYLSHLQR